MAKQNRLIIVLLIAISIISTGLAVWQNYKLHMAHKNVEHHVTRATSHGAYFLYTTRGSIDSYIKENNWDNLKRSDSFLIWLTYTLDSLNNADSTMNDFPSLVAYQDRTNMGDISKWYFHWFDKTVKILNKTESLTEQDKEHISELSSIISKVDGFYEKFKSNDLAGVLDSFDKLHTEWKKVIEEQ